VGLAQRSGLNIVEADPGDLDPEWLVPSIAAGNEPAAARFYDATSGLLFGLLLLILGDTTMAEEVLSEVYAEVREHAALFDRNDENLLTWLITIAHRCALEHLCSSSEDRQFGLASPPGTGRARRFGISKSAHRKLVGATLDSLSPAEQRMIELTYFSRMTPRAIAMRLRQSPDSVKTGLQYGISQLYKLFKNPGFLSEA
jgi:RNA polymerase sigma-70 factor, ECF subfamily